MFKNIIDIFRNNQKKRSENVDWFFDNFKSSASNHIMLNSCLSNATNNPVAINKYHSLAERMNDLSFHIEFEDPIIENNKQKLVSSFQSFDEIYQKERIEDNGFYVIDIRNLRKDKGEGYSLEYIENLNLAYSSMKINYTLIRSPLLKQYYEE